MPWANGSSWRQPAAAVTQRDGGATSTSAPVRVVANQRWPGMPWLSSRTTWISISERSTSSGSDPTWARAASAGDAWSSIAALGDAMTGPTISDLSCVANSPHGPGGRAFAFSVACRPPASMTSVAPSRGVGITASDSSETAATASARRRSVASSSEPANPPAFGTPTVRCASNEPSGRMSRRSSSGGGLPPPRLYDTSNSPLDAFVIGA